MPKDQLAELTQPQRDRLAFIELRVRFVGEIRRQDLVARFGIQSAAATRDLALYKELSPGNIDYDPKGKAYVLGPDFRSIFDFPPERVLSWLTQGFGDGEPMRLKAWVASESPSRLTHPDLDVLASVIAFSNHSFYRGNLVIFPSPYGQGGKLGVRAVYLADAIYENQTNLREAKRVVDAVAEHIATRANESLGVVTLNIKQRDLIAELLEERLRSVRGADSYRDHWASEGQPLFIKNLENVQGDERDAIIISTTFGKPPGSSAVRQNFGPISRQGGWRRLNVLFTRAKKSIALYTSLRPEDIVMDGTTPDGTKALRNYLEYARTGSLPTIEETDREPDSDFEISVMDMLKMRGYEVTPQLGVAGYRIDIAVRHPDAPGSYLAAIECDGASYHSALSVRDRDRIRQEILESLGWRGRIWRIWSTDWFRTPQQESEKLINFLEHLRESWKPEHTSGDAWIEEGQGAGQLTARAIQQIESVENTVQAEREREAVSSVLIDTEDDLEIEVGDVVRYIDLARPNDVMTVQITRGKDDFANGIVNESRPLAQAILGAVVGDEVVLHLAGSASKTFQVVEIVRPKTITKMC